MYIILGDPDSGYVSFDGIGEKYDRPSISPYSKTLKEALLHIYGSDYFDRNLGEFDIRDEGWDFYGEIADKFGSNGLDMSDDKKLEAFLSIYNDEPVVNKNSVKMPLSSRPEHYILLKGIPFKVWKHIDAGHPEETFEFSGYENKDNEPVKTKLKSKKAAEDIKPDKAKTPADSKAVKIVPAKAVPVKAAPVKAATARPVTAKPATAKDASTKAATTKQVTAKPASAKAAIIKAASAKAKKVAAEGEKTLAKSKAKKVIEEIASDSESDSDQDSDSEDEAMKTPPKPKKGTTALGKTKKAVDTKAPGTKAISKKTPSSKVLKK